MTPELEKKIEEAASKHDYTNGVEYCAFIEGAISDAAKNYWQKGMYTEEEVKRLCSKAWLKIPNTVDMLESFDKWFEQNKKKE